MLQQTFKQLLKFLATPTGNWVLLSLGCVVALAVSLPQMETNTGIDGIVNTR